jgi:hypothetical protein
MSAFGKKFLSAFIEVTSEEKPGNVKAPQYLSSPVSVENRIPLETCNTKFMQYFDKLFSEANLPGPDYYEFAKMIEAMNAIPAERARFSAAFAGLNVQGLDKQKLLSTAADYLKLLDDDAANFHATVDSALQGQVLSKQKEMEDKSRRIQELNGEITDLHNKISLLKAEVNENQEKIEANTSGYRAEGKNMKNEILLHIEKIKEHIH